MTVLVTQAADARRRPLCRGVLHATVVVLCCLRGTAWKAVQMRRINGQHPCSHLQDYFLHRGEGQIPTGLSLYTCHGGRYFTETQQVCDVDARHASVTWTRPRQSRYAMPSKSRPEAIKRRSSPVAYPAQCNGISSTVSGEVESLRDGKSQLIHLLQLSALAALTWQAAEFNSAVLVSRAIRH